jgi:hypothetical protein
VKHSVDVPRHNLPPDIEALITSTPPVKDVIEVALSENQTYFISYRDQNSQMQCKHYNLPNPLTEWLYASNPSIIRDLATLSITLGPYESYYAWDKNSASWSNLPAGLEKAVLARLENQGDGKGRTAWKSNGAEAPSFVSLGADGAYFMRTVCGGGCWDLKCGKDGDGREGLDGLRGMNKFLEECRDFSGVAVSHQEMEDGRLELICVFRVSTSFLRIRMRISLFSPRGRRFQIFRSVRGWITIRWRRHYRPSCKMHCRFHRCHNYGVIHLRLKCRLYCHRLSLWSRNSKPSPS